MKRVLGISVYPEFLPREALGAYTEEAERLGFRRVFTSLLLEKLHFQGSRSFLDEDFAAAWRHCDRLGMEVTADIDGEVLLQLGCTQDCLAPIRALGIRGLRVDSGLDPEALARISRNQDGIFIQLNASDLVMPGHPEAGSIAPILEAVARRGDLSQVTACFNFYPRAWTGLAADDLRPTLDLCHRYDVEVSAFVASQDGVSPLHGGSCGVCTVEDHRMRPPEYAMAELFALGVDAVLVGDVRATTRELAAMARLAKADAIPLPVVYESWVPRRLREVLAGYRLLSRRDQPAALIRAAETRSIPAEPFACGPRPVGALTMENRRSLQYMGEVQIPLIPLGPDPAVNVLGMIHPSAWNLLQALKYAGAPFRLVDYGAQADERSH